VAVEEPKHYAFRVSEVVEPETIQQAWKSPEASEWKKAAEEEIASLKENDTWDLVKLPEGRRAVGCKWIFKAKHDSSGQIDRFKARLVANKVSYADPCVYIRKENTLSIVAVYVDDLIIITEHQVEMDRIKDSLRGRFKMKDMGILHYCLGVSVEIDQVAGRVQIGQGQYIHQMLQRYGLKDANPVSTPMDSSVRLVKDDGQSKPVESVLYQSMVGSLLYAATGTRPDIAYAVGVVSKFNGCPTEAHMTAVKRILRYLKGTKDLTLQYAKGSGDDLIGYSDADWAGSHDDRHSTTGNVFLLSGGAISWLSRKQVTVALSTSEAE
jgi:hypothetical protein